MKTVAELAKEMNVAVQTVYRRINKIDAGLAEKITVKINGVTYVTDAGVQALTEISADVKQQLNSVKQEEGIVKQAESDVKLELNDEVVYLREQNRLLQEELVKAMEHSRDQSDRIVTLAEQLAELIRNNQMLLGAEQRRTLIPNEIQEQGRSYINSVVQEQNAVEPKKSWFLKLFKR